MNKKEQIGIKFFNDVFDYVLKTIDNLEKKGEKIIKKDTQPSKEYNDLFIFSEIDNKEVKKFMKVIRVTRIVIDFENENIDKSDSNYNIFFNNNEVDYSFLEEIKTSIRHQEG